MSDSDKNLYWRQLGISLIFTLIGMKIRFDHFAVNELIGDEMVQYRYTVGKALQPVWLWTGFGDITCFKGDYLLNYFVINWFPNNIWMARVPHILVTLAGFVLLYLILRRSVQSTIGFAAAFAIMCFNATLIKHSFEIRPYAVLPTTALFGYFFWEKFLDLDNKTGKFSAIAGGVLIILCVNFHPFGLFTIFLPFLYHFICACGQHGFSAVYQAKKTGILSICIPAVLIWIYFSVGSVVMYPEVFDGTAVHTFAFIPNPLDNPFGFIRSVTGNLLGFKYLYVLLLGLVGIFVGGRQEVRDKVRFLLILIVLAVACILVSVLHKNYWFIQRQFSWVTPFLAILVAMGWDSLIKFFKKKFAAKAA